MSGRIVRLDEVGDGPGFLLIVRGLDPGPAPRTLAELPLRVVVLGREIGMARDPDGRLDAFLDAHGWSAVIVRPDYYVYGGAKDDAALLRLVHGLADDLAQAGVRLSAPAPMEVL